MKDIVFTNLRGI